MTAKIPVTLEGNLTGDPELGLSDAGNEYARFTVAVNDRTLNKMTGLWEDGPTQFHRVVTFNQQARNVANSLHKGDTVVVVGNLRFGTYIDKETGQTREAHDVAAENVGASLKFATVSVERTPKANGPAADRSATGPVVEPASSAGVGIAR